MQNSFRPLIAIVTLLLAVSFAASPFFVESFAGFDPDQFPVPQNNPPIQPAGYAFSIWGIIYGWLILGGLWGLVKAPQDGQWHDMRLPLGISLLIGTFWLAVANASPVWASVMIWAMLLSALAAMFVAPVRDRVWAAYPVGLYAGWLSAASCVSLGLLAAGYGYLDQHIAALIFVALAAVIGTAVQSALGRTPTYGLAVIWGLVAVAVANWNTLQDVAWVAVAGAIITALATLRTLIRS